MIVAKFRSHFSSRLLAAVLLPAVVITAPLTLAAQNDADKAKKDDAAQRDSSRRDVFGGPGLGGGGGGPGMGGFDRPSKMTEDQLKQMVEVIKQVQPDLGAQLETVGQRNLEELRESLSKVSPRFRWLAYMKTHDPEGYEIRVVEQRLQVQATEIAHRLREVDVKNKPQLEQQLKGTLDQHFEARIRVIEHDLVNLEKRIGRLRDDVRMQREQKDQIIADRAAQLIANPDASPTGSSGGSKKSYKK